MFGLWRVGGNVTARTGLVIGSMFHPSLIPYQPLRFNFQLHTHINGTPSCPCGLPYVEVSHSNLIPSISSEVCCALREDNSVSLGPTSLAPTKGAASVDVKQSNRFVVSAFTSQHHESRVCLTINCMCRYLLHVITTTVDVVFYMSNLQ